MNKIQINSSKSDLKHLFPTYFQENLSATKNPGSTPSVSVYNLGTGLRPENVLKTRNNYLRSSGREETDGDKGSTSQMVGRHS